MNADSDFQIGKDHLVCQDYAIAGGKLFECSPFDAYAILCDGCSASPDVDIGARMLALAAKETIQAGLAQDYQKFGEETLRKASNLFLNYPLLDCRALDATLLVAQVKANEINAFIYGDGFFFHKSVNGLYAMKVELTSGAPDYLSYNLDPARKIQYLNYSAADNEKKEVTIYDGEKRTVEVMEPFAPVVISRSLQTGDIVAVCSDGMDSFRRADDSNIPWLELAEEFIGYKNTVGVFVKRRLNAFKKKMTKEGWTHSDDISVAAIVV